MNLDFWLWDCFWSSETSPDLATGPWRLWGVSCVSSW